MLNRIAHSTTALTRVSLGRFRKDEDGATAVTFAMGLSAMLMAVGTGMDFAFASNMHLKAQNIADASALAGAIHVRNSNGRLPKSSTEGFVDGAVYKASDFDYDISSLVIDGADGVSIRVDYAGDYATASVWGQTRPTLMSMFGFETLDFHAETRVDFVKAQSGKPASVFLVLDNSGSMNFDDVPLSDGGSTLRRIDSLQDSVESFMVTMDSIQDALPDDAQRVIRTGFVPYTNNCNGFGDAQCSGVKSNGIIQEHVAPKTFGRVSKSKIDRLRPRAGTNPTGALTKVSNWMRGEEDVHRQEILDKAPGTYNPETFEVLKYVVFMGDGVNDQQMQDCKTVSHPSPELPDHDHYRWTRDNPSSDHRDFHGAEFMYAPGQNRIIGPMRNFPLAGHTHEQVEDPHTDTICKTVNVNLNAPTLDTCSAMKSRGVQIYTIGYGLKPGVYDTNWESQDDYTISPARQNAAYDLLRSCATTPDHFIAAENADNLNEAFEEISRHIKSDMIRVSQ